MKVRKHDAEDHRDGCRCSVCGAGFSADRQPLFLHQRLPDTRSQREGARRCRFPACDRGLSLLVSDSVHGGHLPGQSRCGDRGRQGLGDRGDGPEAGRTYVEFRHSVRVGHSRFVRGSHGDRTAGRSIHRSGERPSPGLGAGPWIAGTGCGQGGAGTSSCPRAMPERFPKATMSVARQR